MGTSWERTLVFLRETRRTEGGREGGRDRSGYLLYEVLQRLSDLLCKLFSWGLVVKQVHQSPIGLLCTSSRAKAAAAAAAAAGRRKREAAQGVELTKPLEYFCSGQAQQLLRCLNREKDKTKHKIS